MTAPDAGSDATRSLASSLSRRAGEGRGEGGRIGTRMPLTPTLPPRTGRGSQSLDLTC